MASPLITVAEARALVLARVVPLPPEDVAIEAALDRVLDADVRAGGDVPPFACSAMDGYAIIAGPAGRELAVIGESRAGAPAEQRVGDGQAIRISTGAAIPAGATAVIPQEQVTVHEDGHIETGAVIDEGQHVRGPGEDMAAGVTVLRAGIRLGPVQLGAAVAAGAGSLSVARAPRVAVLATGDELKPAGEPLGPGEIHNSNAPMLSALATHAGAQVARPRQLGDERHATRTGIEAALESSEVVIISGGVSVGPHDHVKPALAELGVTEVFWSVALQPGKPTWFGTIGEERLVFGLPGNPVSAVVTFSLFVLPALNALQGRREERRLEAEALLGVEVRRNPRREQAIRVVLKRGPGPTTALPNGAQGSHILTSLLGADALAMIPAGEGTVAAGSPVALQELAC
ncbi:MAG TPA: gephyrin-like molybdotransferase Glp [Solirubrobacteraceae bacterium]